MSEITREQRLQEWRAKRTAVPKKAGLVDKKSLPAARPPLVEKRNMSTKAQGPSKKTSSMPVPSVAVTETPAAHRPEPDNKEKCDSPMPFSHLRLTGEPQSLWAATTPSPATQTFLSAPHKNSHMLPLPLRKPRRSVQAETQVNKKEESADKIPSSAKQMLELNPVNDFPGTEQESKAPVELTLSTSACKFTPGNNIAAPSPTRSVESQLPPSAPLEDQSKFGEGETARHEELPTLPTPTANPQTLTQLNPPNDSAPATPVPLPKPPAITNTTSTSTSNRPAATFRQAVAASLIAPSPRSSSSSSPSLPPKLGPHRRVSRAEMALEAALAGRRAGLAEQKQQSQQSPQSKPIHASQDQTRAKRGRTDAELERESAVEEILLLGAVRDAEATFAKKEREKAAILLRLQREREAEQLQEAQTILQGAYHQLHRARTENDNLRAAYRRAQLEFQRRLEAERTAWEEERAEEEAAQQDQIEALQEQMTSIVAHLQKEVAKYKKRSIDLAAQLQQK